MATVLETAFLKEAIAKVSKGSGKDKVLARTELVFIKVDNGVLKLYATDGDIELEIRRPCEAENISCSADLVTLQKLIEKTTTKEISLENDLSKNCLTVVGNGSYTFPIFVEDGEVVEYPEISTPEGESKTLTCEEINQIIDINGSSVSKDPSIGLQFVGYYFYPNGVATCDKKTACITHVGLDAGNFMLSAKAVNILSNLTEDVVKVYVSPDSVTFMTDDMTMVCSKMEYSVLQRFPITDVTNYFGRELSQSILVNKNEFIQALDRLILFKKVFYANSTIRLNFDKEYLGVSSYSGSGIETVSCVVDAEREPLEILVDGEVLKAHLQTCPNKFVDIRYGADKTEGVTQEEQMIRNVPVIFIKEENSTQMITLMTANEV